MFRRKFECVAIGLFGFNQATGLLMSSSLIEPRLDCHTGCSVSDTSSGFLTASLCSIHDASPAWLAE
jgi:hypothetical protein